MTADAAGRFRRGVRERSRRQAPLWPRHCERSEAIHFAARKHGLLRRGACHRARIRATRWLLVAAGRPVQTRLFAQNHPSFRACQGPDRTSRTAPATAVICTIPLQPIARTSSQPVDVVEQLLGNGVTVAQQTSDSVCLGSNPSSPASFLAAFPQHPLPSKTRHHGQLFDHANAGPLSPANLRRLDRELKPGPACEQRLQSTDRLDARELVAEAKMNSCSE